MDKKVHAEMGMASRRSSTGLLLFDLLGILLYSDGLHPHVPLVVPMGMASSTGARFSLQEKVPVRKESGDRALEAHSKREEI